MTRRIFTVAVLLIVVAFAVIFTFLNPGRVALDLGFAAFEAPVSLAFVAAFALGWLFGLASAAAWAYKRRRIRKRREREERVAAEARSMTVADGRG